ncbi:type I CRISPR-associated protein Cas7 [Paracoccus mutanolyticus]|uniref:type I CRISPR-associated protein Cas7 n=1 Tax=Paracoccus mutanolyticus TaxID=1499308 RepID=UPI0037C5565C
MPRIDNDTQKGLVTDVAIKRKIRNYVELKHDGAPPYRIYMRETRRIGEIESLQKPQNLDIFASAMAVRASISRRNVANSSIPDPETVGLVRQFCEDWRTLRVSLQSGACQRQSGLARDLLQQPRVADVLGEDDRGLAVPDRGPGRIRPAA